jgi:hypothetical protein
LAKSEGPPKEPRRRGDYWSRWGQRAAGEASDANPVPSARSSSTLRGNELHCRYRLGVDAIGGSGRVECGREVPAAAPSYRFPTWNACLRVVPGHGKGTRRAAQAVIGLISSSMAKRPVRLLGRVDFRVTKSSDAHLRLPIPPIPTLTLGEPKSLTEHLVSALRSRIINGFFQSGDQLVQTELARSFGVSRGPVRGSSPASKSTRSTGDEMILCPKCVSIRRWRNMSAQCFSVTTTSQ